VVAELCLNQAGEPCERRVRMRSIAIALIVVCVSGVAFSNPGPATDYLYFDVGGGANCIWPLENETFTVTVYLGDLGLFTEDGITEISLRFDRTFEGIKLGQTSWLYGSESGDIEDSGLTLSTPLGECATPNQFGLIPIISVEYLYLGGPGTITPAAHASAGNSLVNCYDVGVTWYLYGNFETGGTVGVGMEPPEGCLGGTPVADVSWGVVKALYR
jgi:hypothetical protein